MKRLVLAFLLLTATLRAEAADWTDIWYDFLHQGFGYNIVQSGEFLYVTFYVYGPGGLPTWYGAGLYWDGVDSYTGTVYRATGTYFGAPWDPSQFVVSTAGTATFKPSSSNNYEATFSYTVGGVGSGSQSIQRQSLVDPNDPRTAIPTGGDYVGGQQGAYVGCTNPNDDYPYVDRFDLTVTHLQNGQATFDFTYAGTLACTLSGTYERHGQYYLIRDASYTCSDGLDTTAQVSEVKATSLGIEGRLYAADVGGGCSEDATFAAVWVQN